MMLLLPLLLAGADVRFETAGVRVGDVLQTGPLLEVRAGALVSGDVVEPLAAALRVEVDGLSLTLEPGVRAARDVDGLRLSAHAPAKLKLPTGTYESVLLKKGAAAWEVDGQALSAALTVGLQQGQQEDPEALMRKMEESAKKMRESSQRVRKPVNRRVFAGGNPFTGSAGADSQSVRQLAELSLSGS